MFVILVVHQNIHTPNTLWPDRHGKINYLINSYKHNWSFRHALYQFMKIAQLDQ